MFSIIIIEKYELTSILILGSETLALQLGVFYSSINLRRTRALFASIEPLVLSESYWAGPGFLKQPNWSPIKLLRLLIRLLISDLTKYLCVS